MKKVIENRQTEHFDWLINKGIQREPIKRFQVAGAKFGSTQDVWKTMTNDGTGFLLRPNNNRGYKNSSNIGRL